jgi:type IV pilus assembly protein PilN
MKLSLNLASRVYVNRRSLMTVYVIVVVLLVLVLALNLITLLRSRAETAKIGERLADLHRAGVRLPEGEIGYSAQALEALNKQILFANILLERDHFRWTDLLDQLEESTPAGISIRGIQPDYKSGVVKLSGVALSVADLRRFLDRLMVSPHFSRVFLFQQSEIQGATPGDRAGVSFSIELKRVAVK